MIVRSYSGRTMAEALAKVRGDLGEHALIIETRTVREAGLLGRAAGIEVVAARDDAVVDQVSAPVNSAASRQERQASVESWRTPELSPLDTQASGLARAALCACTETMRSCGIWPVPLK